MTRGGPLLRRLLLVVALAYVPAAAVTVRLLFAEREEEIRYAEDRVSLLARDGAAAQRAVFRYGAQVLRSAARDARLARGTRAECEAAIAELVAIHTDLYAPTRIDAQGRVDCGGTSPALVGENLSDNPLFRSLRASTDVTVGPYLIATRDSQPLMPLNLAIRDADGTFRGLLSVGLRMPWFPELARRADLPPGSAVTLVDQSGLTLARIPRNDFVGKRNPSHPALAALARDTAGIVRFVGLDGVPRAAAFHRLPSVPDLPVALIIAVPERAVVGAANARLALGAGLLLLGLLAAGGLVWYLSELLVLRDVRRLLDATDRLGAGDLTVRTGLRGRGELERLGEAFDRMAERLADRQERVAQAQKLESLGRLAGGVAHDFNNLLTAIIGHTEGALEELPADSAARQDLRLVLDAARRSGTLTRQLLGFARREPLDAAVGTLDDAVAAVGALLRRVIGEDISLTISACSRRRIRLDVGEIEQAVLNLAVNARDAMPDGGTLHLATHDEDVAPEGSAAIGIPRGQWAVLTVRDTGVGMSDDVRRRIFEPFFTTKPVGRGTGLGLAMVYGTAQRHGGHVTVESAPGAGTTFRLWFPVVATAAEPSAPETRSAAATRDEERDAGARVLVVEDDEAVRRLTARCLRRAGFAVHEAADGEAALATLDGDGLAAIDAVVSDIVMPRMGGPQLVEALRSRRPSLPVVLMSGYAPDGRPEALLVQPRTAFVSKPFEPDELVEAVHRVLRG